MRDSRDSQFQRYQLSRSEVYPRQAIYGFQLAPDGRRLSFICQRDKRSDKIPDNSHKRIRETPLADLCLISSSGGYPRQVTDSGDFSNPAMWSLNGEWLAFERGGSLQVMSSGGGEPRAVFEGNLYHTGLKIGDDYLGYPRWSPDDLFILFATREGSQTTLRMVSKDGRLNRALLSVRGYIIGWDWSPNGRSILLVTRSENGWEGDICLLDVETGTTSILWGESNYKYRMPIAVWAPDGEHIILRSNRSDWAKLYIATPNDPKPQSLTTGEWDDYAFRLGPDGSYVVYASRAGQDGGKDDLWLIPISGGEPKRITQHPGINVPLACAKNGHIYYWHSGPEEPGDVWIASVAGEERTRLTFSAPIELESKLRAPESVWVPSDDGTKIPALIYLPANYEAGRQYPALVWIRGGPIGICRYEFNPIYSWLANQGYVVITPNYRGSIGYGVPHMTAVAGDNVGKNDLSDVLAAGRYVRSLAYVNLERGVGVGGQSWGGYLTLRAITEAPDLFSCAVADAAISDWSIQQAETEVRYYDYWLLGGWVYEQAERVRERSPVNFVDRIQIPILVCHGEEDKDVPFAQIRQFVEIAKRAGVKLQYKFYASEGHEPKTPENQQDRLSLIERFFRRHLQPWNFLDNPGGNQEY